MDLISVIVPVYKVEPYLDRCVQSIVDQTYTNLEIILVDDGSPDQCPQMCDKWAHRDARIRVIHKENGGLSDARNAGMQIASGEYVAFVDSDDAVELDYLDCLYQALKAADADIAECGVLLVNEAGCVLRERGCEEESLVMDKIEALRRLVLEQGVFQTVWNKLYKRRVIETIEFEKGKYHEDEFWTYRVFERAERVTVIRKLLYRYLQRSTSIMGDGYSLKRLDGLEARVRRMRDLQKYSQLAELVSYRIWFDYLFHYQSAAFYLRGQDTECAFCFIQKLMNETRYSLASMNGIKLTHKIWLAMFRMSPKITVIIRNMLHIGL